MSDAAPELIHFGIKEAQLLGGNSSNFGWPIVFLVLGGILNVVWVGFLAWLFVRLMGLY